MNRGVIKTVAGDPVVVAFDDTGSMGDWVDEFYKRAPMFYGQIKLHHYLDDPALSFAVVGDYNGDDEGLQVTDFCRGDALDHALESIYIERGGGGGHKESYQLAAYYYLKKCVFERELAQKPLFFFFGDEGYYEQTGTKEVKDVFNDTVDQAVSSADLFKELGEKFECFILRKPYSMSGTDEVIQADWEQALGPERVIMLETGRQVVDTMLGIIAMRSGVSLHDYLVSLKKRKQTDNRVKVVYGSLKHLADTFYKETNPDGSAFQLPLGDKAHEIPVKGPKQVETNGGSGHTTIINVSGDIITGGKLVKGSEIVDSVLNRTDVEASGKDKKHDASKMHRSWDEESSQKKKKKDDDDE